MAWMARQRERCSTPALPSFRRRHAPASCTRRPENPLALLELPTVAGRPGDEPWVAGGVPLTERLERAFVDRVSDLPDTTRLLLLVAALDDEDRVDEILGAAAAIASTVVDLDDAGPAVDAASSRRVFRRSGSAIR
jgi:hypothetical protein